MYNGTAGEVKKKLIPYQWEMVIWLWLAFFLHQGDRQVFNVVLSLVRDDLGLSDEQMGLVASILIATYGIFVPIAGFAGDVIRRNKIIIVSLLFFSAATLFTGLSTMMIHLILLRSIATGGGEAFYAPAANALISEFHKKTRALAMSIHQTAVYTGIILSGFIAGYIGETYGWRSAFYLYGGVGLILGIVLVFRLKEHPDYLKVKNSGPKVSLKSALPVLFRKPTAILLSLAFACMVFVNVGYLTWMPTFLYEDFNLSLTDAGFSSLFYHHVFAFGGVILGGKLSDMWARRNRSVRLWVQAVSMALAVPFIYLMGAGTSILIIYTALALFGIFRGFYDSNIFASLYEVIEPKYRSSATGIMLMFAFITGAFAPWLLGSFKHSLGLANGLSVLAIMYVIASLLIFIAVRYYFEKDKIEEEN